MARLTLRQVTYESLNGRQKEVYNFQQLSGELAGLGFQCLLLTDDWQGADFIAYSFRDGLSLKVQLKSVLTVDTKYKDKDIWIAFKYRRSDIWFMYPHDDFLRWALNNTGIGRTKGWQHPEDWELVSGRYTWPAPTPKLLQQLGTYVSLEDGTGRSLSSIGLKVA